MNICTSAFDCVSGLSVYFFLPLAIGAPLSCPFWRCMCVHVCVYVCVCARMYVYVCVCAHMHVRVGVCTLAYGCVHLCVRFSVEIPPRPGTGFFNWHFFYESR